MNARCCLAALVLGVFSLALCAEEPAAIQYFRRQGGVATTDSVSYPKEFGEEALRWKRPLASMPELHDRFVAADDHPGTSRGEALLAFDRDRQILRLEDLATHRVGRARLFETLRVFAQSDVVDHARVGRRSRLGSNHLRAVLVHEDDGAGEDRVIERRIRAIGPFGLVDVREALETARRECPARVQPELVEYGMAGHQRCEAVAVQRGEVVALVAQVDDELPVCGDLIAPGLEDGAAVEGIPLQCGCDVVDEVPHEFDRHLRAQPHDDQTRAVGNGQGNQIRCVAGLVEGARSRSAGKVAVEVVAPSMEATDQPGTRAGTLGHTCAAVRAGVHEGAKDPVLGTRREDGDTHHLRGHEGTRSRELAGESNDLRRVQEQPLALLLVTFEVEEGRDRLDLLFLGFVRRIGDDPLDESSREVECFRSIHQVLLRILHAAKRRCLAEQQVGHT